MPPVYLHFYNGILLGQFGGGGSVLNAVINGAFADGAVSVGPHIIIKSKLALEY